MKFEESRFYDAIALSDPVPEIASALADDLKGAGIISEQDPNALIGSRLFNVASAAMGNLRSSPDKPLVERELAIEEPEDWLGKYVMRLLNDSLRRPFYGKLPQFRSGVVGKLDTSNKVEDRILDQDVYDSDKPGQYFIDSLGHIILFKTAEGQQATVTTKAIQINRVRYPAGVLLNLVEAEDVLTELIQGYRIATTEQANVDKIAPMRFMPLAFRPEDRRRHFTPVIGHELRHLELLEEDDCFSDLVGFAPDKRSLIGSHKRLKRPI